LVVVGATLELVEDVTGVLLVGSVLVAKATVLQVFAKSVRGAQVVNIVLIVGRHLLTLLLDLVQRVQVATVPSTMLVVELVPAIGNVI